MGVDNSGQGCLNLVTDGIFKHRLYIPTTIHADVPKNTSSWYVDLTSIPQGSQYLAQVFPNQKCSFFSNVYTVYNSHRNFDEGDDPVPFIVDGIQAPSWSKFSYKTWIDLWNDISFNQVYDILAAAILELDNPADNPTDEITMLSQVYYEGEPTGDFIRWKVDWQSESTPGGNVVFKNEMEFNHPYTSAEYNDFKDTVYYPRMAFSINDYPYQTIQGPLFLHKWIDNNNVKHSYLRELSPGLHDGGTAAVWKENLSDRFMWVDASGGTYTFKEMTGKYYAINFIQAFYRAADNSTASTWTELIRLLNTYLEQPKPYIGDRTPDEFEDTEGTYDSTSDDHHITAIPTLNSSSAGFVNVYEVSSSELTALASFMWSNDVMSKLATNAINPMDMIVSAHVIPGIPSTSGQNYIQLGPAKFDADAGGPLVDVVTSDFVELSVAPYHVDRYYGLFPDFKASISLYIPFLGWRDIDVQDVMDRTFQIKYRINAITGDFVTWLDITDEDGHNIIPYEWTGNCRSTIMLSQAQYSPLSIVGLLGGESTMSDVGYRSATNSILGGLANIAGGTKAGSALPGVSSAANTFLDPSVKVSHTGSISGVLGFMADRQAMIKIHLDNYLPTNGFEKLMGYKSMYKGTISDFTGYGEFDNVVVDDTIMTEAERDDIVSRLSKGVYNNYRSITDPSGAGYIYMYTNRSDAREIYKDITYVDYVTGVFKDTQNVNRIVVNLETAYSSLASVNYVYMPDFGRWYYITEKSVVNSSITQVVLETDTLMTYREAIQTFNCLCLRSETKYNRQQVDEKLPKVVKDLVYIREIGNPLISENIILVTVG